MSSRAHSSAVTSKDKGSEGKLPTTAVPQTSVKPVGVVLKGANKLVKEMPSSPHITPPPTQPPPVTEERAELLGSLTTQQQQRTSARVIKKLRLDDAAGAADRDKKELLELEATHKVEDKDKLQTVKQRMPKALWSTDEKNLLFEALNEYGKDFDAITAYICSKMKKKGVSDANLKTKHQVSHFYYRTWHKLSKHVHFDENVKKVAQELYALINYGELRKKLSSVNEKTCARLGEMVACGSIVVRARGRNLRVRTPMCRALRKLNQITERCMGPRVCTRAVVALRARCAASWARVQAAAHNPRAAVSVPLRTELRTLIRALQARWSGKHKRSELILPEKDAKQEESSGIDHQDGIRQNEPIEDNLEDHLNLETERMIIQNKKLTLHLGPRPNADIHLPTISPGEQLSSQKICFTSYLERMGTQRVDKDGPPKIRTPKRQRKDSTTEKEKEIEQKKIKTEDNESNKLMNIDETAIDGIELMASLTENKILEEDKPSTEPEDLIEDLLIERDSERDKEMSEREKDSFSEMEDDEKFNKSDTDNESDKGEKIEKERKFKNLKVKFRIRPKKRGGNVYTLVPEPPKEEDLDVEAALAQVRTGWSVHDAGKLTIGDLYLMFGYRSKLELDYWWGEPSPPLPHSHTQQKINKPETEKHGEKEKTPLAERIKVEKITPDKESEEDRERQSDNEIFSPKNVFNQDSNDGLSGDERKCELVASPEHNKGTLRVADKLVNRARPHLTNYRTVMTDRLRRLLSLASSFNARCGCGNVCALHRRKPPSERQPTFHLRSDEVDAPVFRHPTPIAPKSDDNNQLRAVDMEDIPRIRRGRPRRVDSDVVVQRLLPVLPKLSPNHLFPVKLVSNTRSEPYKILPKPPAVSSEGTSYVYVVRDYGGQLYLHSGDTDLPPADDHTDQSVAAEAVAKSEPPSENGPLGQGSDRDPDNITGLLGSESLSLSPSRLLSGGALGGGALGGGALARGPDEGPWLPADVQDFSLSSFLAHLDQTRAPDGAMDSQLQSLMTESSIDYVAKFADLAAEVSADTEQEHPKLK